MKVLNLYAGLGGNRKLWPDDLQVTAVELDPEIAAIYQKHFPQDTVIVGDAHVYLLEHFAEFDFIWSSPPCPTHSDIRRMKVDAGVLQPKFPDMKLYEEIIFLMHFAPGKWVVENVESYYKPLIPPVLRGRHYFWSNFTIPDFKTHHVLHIRNVTASSIQFGFSLQGEKLKHRKDQLLRNCVDPALGLHVLRSAFKVKQEVLA